MTWQRIVRALRERWIPVMRNRGWQAELVNPGGADPILLIDHDERFVRIPLGDYRRLSLTTEEIDALVALWVDTVPVSDPEAAAHALPSPGWDPSGAPVWRLVVPRARRWLSWRPGALTTASGETQLWRRAVDRVAWQQVSLDGVGEVHQLRCTPGPASSALAWGPGMGVRGALVAGTDVVFVGRPAELRRLRDSEFPHAVLLDGARLRDLSGQLRELAQR